MYLVRHGQSEANILGIMSGIQSDCSLTSLGIKQAQEAGAQLINSKISRIYSSPLIRALDTAKEIANVINFSHELIILDKRIVAYDWGNLTNQGNAAISNLRENPTVENLDIFKNRVKSFLNEIRNFHEEVLIVTHASTQRMIDTVLLDLEPDKFTEIQTVKNATVVEYQL